MKRKEFPFSNFNILDELNLNNDFNLIENEILDSKYYLSKSNSEDLILGLGITDRCNLNCRMCYYKVNENEKRSSVMNIELLDKILSSIGGIGSVIIGLEGEPLTHPNFLEVLKKVSSVTNSIYLVSNGLLLTEDIIKNLNKNKVKELIISCDGSSKNVYENIRTGGNFLRLSEKIKIAASCFEGSLKLHAVVSSLNITDLVNLPSFASRLGVKKLSFAQLRTCSFSKTNNIVQPSIESLKEFIKKIMLEAEKNDVHIELESFFASGELLTFIEDYYKSSEYLHLNTFKVCPSPWNFVSILSDGRLFACCGDIEPVILERFSFDDIYNHELLRKLRYLLLNSKKLPKVCQNCFIGGEI